MSSQNNTENEEPPVVDTGEWDEGPDQNTRHHYIEDRWKQKPYYRRLAVTLAGFGVLAVLGGFAFPQARDVLFGFGATGLFGSVLTHYLTGAKFVEATTVESIYAPVARNGAALSDSLGLQPWTDGTYVPADDAEPARLHLSASPDADRPPDCARIPTTGGSLFKEFERSASVSPVIEQPGRVASQLTDALVEQFELVGAATVEVDVEDGCASIEVTDSVLGNVDRFDHPVASFLAVGFAVSLSEPVTVDVVPVESAADWLITCRWEST